MQIVYPYLPACPLQDSPNWVAFWFTYAGQRSLFVCLTGPDAPTKLHPDGTVMLSCCRLSDHCLIFLKVTDVVLPAIGTWSPNGPFEPMPPPAPPPPPPMGAKRAGRSKRKVR